MGGAASKAVRRSYPSAAAPAAARSDPALQQAQAVISRQELEREEQLKLALREPAVDLQARDEGLLRSVQQLAGSIASHAAPSQGSPEMDRLYSRRRLTAEEKEARLRGRLPTASLKLLLEDAARAVRNGRAPDAAALAREYGADPAAVGRLLAHASAPLVQLAEDGRLVGRWPTPAASG